MFGATENRGVSTLIGFILVFGIIVTSWTVLQAVKVPAENQQTEFDHNEKAQADLLNVRDSMLRSGTTGVQQSTTIQVGADYAQRAITVNLAASSGAIRTRDPSGTGDNRIVIENVRALDAETRDYLNRSISVSTKSIVYRPKYSQYSNAPDTVIAGGAGSVINDHAEVNLSIADQILIKDRTITIVAINGSLSKAKSGESATVQLDTDPLSVAERKVTIQDNASGPLTLTIPTQLDDESVWDQSGLEAQPRVTDVDNTTANNVTITLKDGTYTLRMMQIGVGSGTEQPGAEYITDGDTPKSVVENASTVFSLDVRDRFNNPVDGFQVNGSIFSGPADSLSVLGEDDSISGTGGRLTADASAGRVRYNYTAPNVDGKQTVKLNFSIYSNSLADTPEKEEVWVNFTVADLDSSGDASDGSVSGDEAGQGADSDYNDVESQNVTSSGGIWKNITGATEINLSNPKYTPLVKPNGDPKQNTRYLKLGFTFIEDTSDNTDHRYYFIVDLAYKPSDGWDTRLIYMYEQMDNGSVSTTIDGVNLKTTELDKFESGSDPLELLDGSEYDSDKTTELSDINDEISDGDPDKILFTTMRGRASMTIE